MTRLLLVLSFGLLFNLSYSQTIDIQNYRTYDGSYNNLQNPHWGKAGDQLIRFAPNTYADGISSIAGPNRPNPRAVSNAVFAQNDLINDQFGISDFCWVFGQFIDHDIDLTPDGSSELVSVNVPAGDIWFDPLGTGEVEIPILRNIYIDGTGTSIENPREHPNVITAFIDGSTIYGSDEERANWLRSHEGGKLKTSTGNLLPYNTVSGEFYDAIDPEAPHMDNATGISDKLFVSGDSRANENTLLTSTHTLFVREHNRLCDIYSAKHPDWTDEQIYQHVKKLVGGLIQSIVYNEWLPAMGLEIAPYAGYNPDVNPQIMNLFSGAAYRLGHTLLSGTFKRLDNEGNAMPIGDLQLRNAYFNPFSIMEAGGIEPYFKGMATHMQQKLDAKMVDDVRNFLFGAPGSGGLDLAAINIQRGRERGIADYNAIREAFGLPRYHFFQQINSDAVISNSLMNLYLNINDIDPWVGLLAEPPLSNSIYGPTLTEIMKAQFTALRDGDRFFYENDPVLSAEERLWIERMTFRDVIMYNTGITLMQDNVFKAMPHDDICNNLFVDIMGTVATPDGAPVADVVFTADHETQDYVFTTGADGVFGLEDMPGCGMNELNINKSGEILNGVSTFDILLIQKHILAITPFTTPYEYIAADVNNSGSISTLDIINLRKVILGIQNSFPNNQSWRFVNANFAFPNPSMALTTTEWEDIYFDGLLGANFLNNFIAVKIGDINGNVNPNEAVSTNGNRSNSNIMQLDIQNVKLTAGNTYLVALNASAKESILGYQYALNFDNDLIHINGFKSSNPAISDEHFVIEDRTNEMKMSWTTSEAFTNQMIGYLELQAIKDVTLSEAISIDKESTVIPEAYTQNLTTGGIQINFHNADESTVVSNTAFAYPNPFATQTTLGFNIAKGTDLNITVYDVSGKIIYIESAFYAAGYQNWVLNANHLPQAGTYFVEILGTEFNETIKVVLTK